MPKLKVALVHPRLGFGGSEAAVVWTLQALREDHDLTLISAGQIDIHRLNRYYGTDLNDIDFVHRRIPMPIWLEKSGKFAALQGRFQLRYVRKVASEFDVVIGLYGPMDCGRPCIQRIADLSFVEEWRFSHHSRVQDWSSWWYAPSSPVRKAYMGICDLVCSFSPEGWKHNLTLSNSAWTQALMREKFGVESIVGYAPVVGEFPQVPFSERERGFVCIGRISPEKRVDAIVEILSQVRARGHDIHLHIMGGVDRSEYGTRIKSLARRHGDWVFIEDWTQGEKKKALLTGHRYGIHARENEPFGIAVAEMVLAGCLVFVPNGGGQVEIVDRPELIFKDDADAVGKIDAILASDVEQERVRAHLLEGSHRFSPPTFMGIIRRVLAEFLDKRCKQDKEPTAATE